VSGVRALVLALLALLVVVTTTSAWVRLAQGEACARGECAGATSRVPDAPVAVARTVHRFAASAAGLVIVALLAFGWRDGTRSERAALATLVALALALATLGRIAAPGAPAVTACNLLGGMTMVAAAAWLASRTGALRDTLASPALRAWSWIALALMAELVAIAALASADTSHALPHAGLALAVEALLAWLGLRALRSGERAAGGALLGLAAAQLVLGSVAALAGPIPVVAVAHNLANAGATIVLATLLGRHPA
jgi:heme A synthase